MTPHLPPAVTGERFELNTTAGLVSGYRAGPDPASGAKRPPLLLVHSVNAAGSVAEVAPLFEHYRLQRTVYAVDLPGFGFSDRSDRAYTPRLMTDALIAVIDAMRTALGGVAVDVLAVSLACEFAARAACEVPQSIDRLILVSPTGFSGTRRRYGPAGSTLGLPWLHGLLTRPAWTQWVYDTLTRPGVIRYFLQRTWGSRQIDEALWQYDLITTRQPGARHAPLYFVSAYLFSKDINTLYEAVTCPVWVSMPTRGDFTDYQGIRTVQGRPQWQFHPVEGGALPYFEDLQAFTKALDPFFKSL